MVVSIQFCSFQVGDGSLALKSIAGIDVDGQAVKRGLKRIEAKHAETLVRVQNLLHFAAYQADMCCQAASLPGAIPFLSVAKNLILISVLLHLYHSSEINQ